MGLVINENKDAEGTKRIDKILGLDDKAVAAFEKKFATFMNAALDNIVKNEDGVNSADLYQNVKDTFEGAELELFISQITSHALMSVIEVAEAQTDPLRAILSGMLDASCGPDCGCNDGDEDAIVGVGEGGLA